MEAAESLGAGAEKRVEEWARGHEALSQLRRTGAALDAEEGTWLLRAFRAATHVYFGYASFGEYIERLFGLRRRTTEEKLRVAGALEALPELAEALRSAKLHWSVVRELTRVAVRETEREWIFAVRGTGQSGGAVRRAPRRVAPRPAAYRRESFCRSAGPPRRRHYLRLHAVATGGRGQRQGVRGAPEPRFLGEDCAGQPRAGALERSDECDGRDAAALGR